MLASVATFSLDLHLYMTACKVLQSFRSRHRTACNARGVLAAYSQRLSRSYDAYKPVTCLLRFSHHDCTAPKPGCAHRRTQFQNLPHRCNYVNNSRWKLNNSVAALHPPRLMGPVTDGSCGSGAIVSPSSVRLLLLGVVSDNYSSSTTQLGVGQTV